MSKIFNTDLDLVIRFSENLRSAKDVIGLHNDVVVNLGFVLFGKMGSKLSQSRIDELNNEISKEKKRFLYLVKSKNNKMVVFRAAISKAFLELPSKEKKYIPSYYFDYDLSDYIHSWIKISQINQVENKELIKLRAVGSMNSISETLGRSSSGHFWVQEKISL